MKHKSTTRSELELIYTEIKNLENSRECSYAYGTGQHQNSKYKA